MYNQQPKVNKDEILVNSYVRKKKMNKPTNAMSKPLNPMQRLGQKVSSMMPKLPNMSNRIKGGSNNKYNFRHSWAERFVNTQKLSKFGYDYNYNQDFLVGGNPVVSDYYNQRQKRAKMTNEWLNKLSNIGKKPKTKSRAKFNASDFFSVHARVTSNPVNEFKMSWSAREKISKAQRENNSNYKHGNRLDYRHISNWIPNEIIHHIDGNHHNNSEDNLISIPGYIPDTNEIKTLSEWKRIVNCKLHEEIHRRACKDEITLPTKEEILEMVNKEYPNYYEEVRPKLLEHYDLLKIKDKYIEGNEELEQKINKIRGILKDE